MGACDLRLLPGESATEFTSSNHLETQMSLLIDF